MPKFQRFEQIEHDGEGFLKHILEPGMTYLYYGTESMFRKDFNSGVSIIDKNNCEIRLDHSHLDQFRKVERSNENNS